MGPPPHPQVGSEVTTRLLVPEAHRPRGKFSITNLIPFSSLNTIFACVILFIFTTILIQVAVDVS